MYRPRCWEAILFLATTSYLFSKTYPSPGEELRGKENAGLDVWFWLLFVPDTPTPEKNRGLKLDLKIHFWGLEKRYIHSWRQSDRTHTRKERSVWMCGAFTSYWKFGDIASAGFIFCGWWKPRARVRSQILIGDSPSSPPPQPLESGWGGRGGS